MPDSTNTLRKGGAVELGLRGRTAIVTGASAGIGRGSARTLAEEGAMLAIVARRRHLLDEAADEIAAACGRRPLVIDVDVTDHGASNHIIRTASEALGRIDILVNSAGGSRPVEGQASDEQWDEAMAVDFTSTRRLTEAALPQMIGQRWGRVVHMTGSSEPHSMNLAHPAKAALHAWSKSLSRLVARHGVTLNCVAPAGIRSEQVDRMFTEEQQAAYIEGVPAGYWAEPRDAASLIALSRRSAAGTSPVRSCTSTAGGGTSRSDPAGARSAHREIGSP